MPLSTDDISSRFFHGLHRWIPIISETHFLHHRTITPWKADFSLLILAMGLITHHRTLLDTESLYLATKTMFAQVQAFTPLSVTLLQAGILLAYFEYAHHLPDTAFISLGLCSRIGYALDLDKWPRESREETNIWWAIVILERYDIFCSNYYMKLLTCSGRLFVKQHSSGSVWLLNFPQATVLYPMKPNWISILQLDCQPLAHIGTIS